MIGRGDGVGIEVGPTVIRGVRLSADLPTRVLAAREVSGRSEGPEDLVDALDRLRAELGPTEAPTRLAWFPPGAALQRVDATGLDGRGLDALRHRLAAEHGITSTMLVDSPPRRWMITLRWRSDVAWELQEIAERAGFVDVEVEPAPVSVQRVLQPAVAAVRRDPDDERSWVMISRDRVPLAAAHLDAVPPPGAHLTASTARRTTEHLDELLTLDALAGAVLAAAGGDLAPRPGTVAALQLAGEAYPRFPPHDLRSADRCGVALGAAIGAAGLAGRARPVDVIGRRPSRSVDLPRPWAIEEVAEELDPAPVLGDPSGRRGWFRGRRARRAGGGGA